MQKYSDFFKTLHDETSPTGHLGRGTHYSVLRAVVFHNPSGKPLAEGRFCDFAIVWDEDHDVRVLEPIEEIYCRGLLSSFLTFGERKGSFTAIVSHQVARLSEERVAFLRKEVNAICQSLSDPWLSAVVDRDSLTLRRQSNPIIDDEDDKVALYLKNLEMLWQLGTVTRAGSLPFKSALLERVEGLDISVRTAHALKSENIEYIGDLVRLTEAELLRTQMGRKSLNEIKEVLSQMGLYIGMEVAGWPPENIESRGNQHAESAAE